MDAIIIGGGVIGLSLARELAGQGVAVRVLEQGRFGKEASWAGAGMLPPGNPAGAQSPSARLRAESAALWPELSAELFNLTGVDNGYRNSGGLCLTLEPHGNLDQELARWAAEGVEVEKLSASQLRRVEPAVTDEAAAAYRLPEFAQIRNPRHVKALQAACAARSVELLEGQAVVDLEHNEDRVTAVRTTTGVHRAGMICVTAGAWSRQIVERAGCRIDVAPVRGQIVLLACRTPLFTHVIEDGSRYLVPRPDGRVLIGSTEEHVGFDKRSTAEAVRGLIEFGTRLVPALSDATVERTWAGLRPGSRDGLPYLGCVPGYENLFVATGHFRSGLQTSPATAVAMTRLMLDQEPLLPLEPYACYRAADEAGRLTGSR